LETEILHKYLSGECTDVQNAEVERWLQDSPQNQEKLNNMKQIWNVSPGKRIHVDPEDAWELFRTRVLDTPQRNANKVVAKRNRGSAYQSYEGRRRHKAVRILTYSAAVAAVLMIAFLFSYPTVQEPVPATFELSMQEITTEKGQHTTVRLSDGTRVQLNGDSKLMIPGNFTENNRIVTLEGEAFFEVIHRSDSQFFVQANNSITEVLGTKFNVRAYPDEENVEVVVTEGKVSMRSDESMYSPEVQLTQNQRGTLSKNGEVTASTVPDVKVYMGWTKGQLVFQEASVQQVKARLERWFDIDVELAGDINSQDKLLTGTFENTPLTVVLASISMSLDLQYQQDGNVVIFKK